jgi:hypothetical protein
MQGLELPCTVWHYVQLEPSETQALGAVYAGFTYRLLGIEHCTRTVPAPIECIERSTLGGSDLAQLQLFNEVYISECNTLSLRLVFHDLDGLTYACAPTADGRLRVESREDRGGAEPALPPDAVRPSPYGGGDVYFAASAYTVVHDYVETHSGRCFHVGLSLLPVGPLFLPLWLSPDRMRQALSEWQAPRFDTAKREALLAVRWLRGECSVRHALSRVREKHDPIARPD